MAISYFTSHTSPGVLTVWQGSCEAFFKFNEPYIIWDRLRLTLSHSERVLCFSQVKQCRVRGRGATDINLYSPVGRMERVSLHTTVTDWGALEPAGLAVKRGGWTPSGTLDLHASVRPTGGSSPASANSGLRLNVIHPPLLRWDFSSSTSQSYPAGTQKQFFEFPVAWPASRPDTTPSLFNTDTG